MISSSRRWLLPKMGTEYGLLEADEQLPRTISSASLELSQTELLAKLKERLEEIRGADGMAEKVFHPEKATVDWRDIPVSLDGADESMKLALQKCFGSEVTFLWGPPRTGKTFSIAQLAASFLETGSSVRSSSGIVTTRRHILRSSTSIASKPRKRFFFPGAKSEASGARTPLTTC